MGPKTLFDVAKPIIFVLNFMGYGLGWETRKSSGWVKGLLKWMLKINVSLILITCNFTIVGILFLYEFDSKCMYVYYAVRGQMFLMGVPCLDYFFLLNETQLRNLVGQFRLFPVTKDSGKALKKCLRPFYFYLAINMIPLTVIFCWLCTVGIPGNKTIIGAVIYVWLFPSLFLLTLFPVFLCYFACLVPIYCVARMKELVQEFKGARSNLRRAKMTSDLIREYYRLKQLVSMTDETLSKVMSFFHELFVMFFALTVATADSGLKVFWLQDGVPFALFIIYPGFLVIFFVYVFPFLMYKRVAPPANQMHSLIFEALVDIALVDDERLSRDPILRPLLIKMRVLHVFDVSHIVLAEASFTHFGEAIEGEALFAIFLESFDMYNTITAPARHLSIAPSLKTDLVSSVQQCRTRT